MPRVETALLVRGSLPIGRKINLTIIDRYSFEGHSLLRNSRVTPIQLSVFAQRPLLPYSPSHVVSRFVSIGAEDGDVVDGVRMQVFSGYSGCFVVVRQELGQGIKRAAAAVCGVVRHQLWQGLERAGVLRRPLW